MKSDSSPEPDVSKLIARATLLLLGSGLSGYLAPEVAAFGLVSIAVLAGCVWKQMGWRCLIILVGGIVGLAARNSGGSPERFRSNLAGMAVLAVAMVGVGVMASGASGSRRFGRRR